MTARPTMKPASSDDMPAESADAGARPTHMQWSRSVSQPDAAPPAPLRIVGLEPARFTRRAAAALACGLCIGYAIGARTSPRATRPAAPVAASVVAPVAAPVVAPVAAPVASPVVAPVASPVASPVVAPAEAPRGESDEARFLAGVEEAARSHAGRINDCARRARTHEPSLAGRVRVTAVVGDDGSVREAGWSRAEPSQRRALGCITSAMRRWRLPAPGAAGVHAVVLEFDLGHHIEGVSSPPWPAR